GWAFQWKIGSFLSGAGAISGWICAKGTNVKSDAGDAPNLVLKYALKLAPLVFLITFTIGLSALTNWALYKTGSLYWTAEDKDWRPVLWWEQDLLLEHTHW